MISWSFLLTINIDTFIIIDIKWIEFGSESMVNELKALSDESRLEIVILIAKRGELCGCEIEKHFSISQSTVSHHMKILTNSNIISERKEGRSHYYSLNKDVLQELVLYLKQLL